jgi:hypothetical protein
MQSADRDAPDSEAPLLLALGLAFCASMPAGFPGTGALPAVAAKPALVATVHVDTESVRGSVAAAGQRVGDAK